MGIKRDLNIYRRYFDWNKVGGIFIHVPKVAGTSVSHALYGKSLGHYSAVQIEKKFPKLYKRSYVFALYRDPLERLYSAYNFAKIGRTESMGVENPEQYQIPEFDTFESFVLQWIREKSVNSLDNIFKEQAFYVCDTGLDLIVDRLFSLERIDSMAIEIERRLGKKMKIHKKNISQRSIYSKNKVYGREMELVALEKYKNDVLIKDRFL